jgi:hypothetical protein
MFSLSVWYMFGLPIAALLIWAFVVIFDRVVNRAGYSRWWLLTAFVPLLNPIMVWVFAFADWPVTKSRGQT